MLAADDVRLAEEVVRDLRAQGQEERARALEAVLAAATGKRQRAAATAEHLTPSQVARALHLRTRTVQSWIDEGRLPVERSGGSILVRRDALLQYLAGLRSKPAEHPRLTPEERAAREQLDRDVLGGLPREPLARLEALHEKMEAGERLSRAECAEMAARERPVTSAAGQRLEDWMRQASSRQA
jgi:excisionase family DNA binding protein